MENGESNSRIDWSDAQSRLFLGKAQGPYSDDPIRVDGRGLKMESGKRGVIVEFLEVWIRGPNYGSKSITTGSA